MKSPCFGVNSSFSQKFKGGILGRTPGRILCIFAAFSHCVPHMFLIFRPCFIISFSPVPTIKLFSWHFPSFSYICPICTTCLPHFPHVFPRFPNVFQRVPWASWQDFETAEEARAHRLGVKRESRWAATGL